MDSPPHLTNGDHLSPSGNSALSSSPGQKNRHAAVEVEGGTRDELSKDDTIFTRGVDLRDPERPRHVNRRGYDERDRAESLERENAR